MHMAKYVERARSFQALSKQHSPLISMCSPTQKFSESCSFEFLWWLHYTGMINQNIGYWQSIQTPAPSPLPKGQGGGAESSNLLIVTKMQVCVPDAQ